MKRAADDGPIVTIWQNMQPFFEGSAVISKFAKTLPQMTEHAGNFLILILILGLRNQRHDLRPGAVANVDVLSTNFRFLFRLEIFQDGEKFVALVFSVGPVIRSLLLISVMFSMA